MKTTQLKLTALFAALLLGSLALPVRATTLLALSLEELVTRADLIVLGSVMRTESRWAKPGRMIVTDAEVQVTQSLKGDTPSGGTIVVTLPGGAVDSIALTIPGAPHLSTGQQALLFLQRGKSQSDLRIVGMSQGALVVVAQNGVSMIVPPENDADLVTRNADGKFSQGAPAVPQATALSDLVSRIKTLIK